MSWCDCLQTVTAPKPVMMVRQRRSRTGSLGFSKTKVRTGVAACRLTAGTGLPRRSHGAARIRRLTSVLSASS